LKAASYIVEVEGRLYISVSIILDLFFTKYLTKQHINMYQQYIGIKQCFLP